MNKPLSPSDIEQTLSITTEQLNSILTEWIERNFQNSCVKSVEFKITEPSKFTPSISPKLSGVKILISQNNT